MRKILTATMAATALAAAGNASAATVTTTFGVTATVLKTCSVAANPLGFGNYAPGSGALAANTTVNVKCTKGTTFSVALNGGTTAGGTIAQRLMSNGTDKLEYNLYTTAAFATVFGDGTTGSTVPGTGTGVATAVALTVFGSLPDNAINQNVSTGAYSDTINVTVTY
ncbi:MAG: Csu type fimbrial protein [Steroidobacteraceae bacterium]